MRSPSLSTSGPPHEPRRQRPLPITPIAIASMPMAISVTQARTTSSSAG
jgi:hypothetical protein